MTPTPAPGLASLCDRLVGLWRRAPTRYREIDLLVTAALAAPAATRRTPISDLLPRESGQKLPDAHAVRRPRTLDGPLREVHDCPKPKGGGFVQLQLLPMGNIPESERQARELVTLERSRS